MVPLATKEHYVQVWNVFPLTACGNARIPISHYRNLDKNLNNPNSQLLNESSQCLYVLGYIWYSFAVARVDRVSRRDVIGFVLAGEETGVAVVWVVQENSVRVPEAADQLRGVTQRNLSLPSHPVVPAPTPLEYVVRVAVHVAAWR